MKSDSERPPDSDFHQQNLASWQPLLTPGWVIGTFLVVALIFIPVGVVVIIFSNKVVEVSARYDQLPCHTSDDRGCWVTVSLPIPRDMEPPIYFYYKLTNFYQNHRRYVKSRSDNQLRGLSSADTSTCDPLEKDAGGRVLYPCGLIANSYFNDTFQNASRCDSDSSCTTVTWTDQGIAWPADRDTKYKLPSNIDTEEWNRTHTRIGSGNFTLPLPVQEDFIVWMRTAGLPSFRKLRYRILDQGFKAGQVFYIDVYNTFPVAEFGGTKSVIISTSSWLGGKNAFLGGAYLVVGGFCALLAIGFAIKRCVNPRPLGDMKYLSLRK